VYFWNEEPPDIAAFGSASLTVVGHEPLIKAMWFRGGWFDSISSLWREVTEEKFETNDGNLAAHATGRNGGSILLEGSLKPGDSITYPIVITWYFPNPDKPEPNSLRQ
jgi:hypothetical protein